MVGVISCYLWTGTGKHSFRFNLERVEGMEVGGMKGVLASWFIMEERHDSMGDPVPRVLRVEGDDLVL